MNRSFADYQLHETLRAPEPFVSAYIASPTGHNRLVELRVLNAIPELAPAEVEKRLALVRSLTHPTLLRIVDLGSHERAPFLATDFKESITLADYLVRQGGRLDPELAFDLLLPLAEGLRVLNEKGVRHGDVSAETIRVETASERAFLSTISMARLLGITASDGGFRSMVSTAAFTPEAAEGWPLSERTDLFLLAAVLYHAVTGKRLPTLSDVAGQPRTPGAVPTLPSVLVPGLGAAVDRAIMPGLQYKPEDRLASLAMLIEAIRGGREAVKDDAAPRRGASRAIHLASIEKKQEQVDQGRRRKRTRSTDTPGALQVMANRFARLGLVARTAMFVALALGSAQMAPPAFLLAPSADARLDQFETNRALVANKQFDRPKVESDLRDAAEDAVKHPTNTMTFTARMLALQSYLKSLKKEDHDKLLSAQAEADMRILYAGDQKAGSAALDKALAAAAGFLKAHTGS